MSDVPTYTCAACDTAKPQTRAWVVVAYLAPDGGLDAIKAEHICEDCADSGRGAARINNQCNTDHRIVSVHIIPVMPS